MRRKVSSLPPTKTILVSSQRSTIFSHKQKPWIKNASTSKWPPPPISRTLDRRRSYSRNKKKTHTIIVENNGPMIPNHQLGKIFEKFYTTKGKRNGSGLGLSIVKNVLEEHKAKITVNSDQEKTQFTITFNKEK